jgi:sugar phosphate isomerase/epimerase
MRRPSGNEVITAMKISVFTVMLPNLTPEQAAQALQASGYDGVEWRVTRVPPERQHEPPSYWGNNLCTLAPTEADARRARQLANAAGLAIPSLGTYIAAGDLEAVEAGMQFAQLAGAPQLRVGAGSLDRARYSERFSAAQQFLARTERLAGRYGVKALIEIHHGTLCPSASAAYRLVSDFNPASIGVIYDPGNMVYEGYEDYRLGIELLGPYLAHVHIKNAAYARPAEGGIWRPGWAPFEDGVVDFVALFRALAASGYDGWLSMEDFSGVRPTLEALQYNIAFVRRALARARDADTGLDSH